MAIVSRRSRWSSVMGIPAVVHSASRRHSRVPGKAETSAPAIGFNVRLASMIRRTSARKASASPTRAGSMTGGRSRASQRRRRGRAPGPARRPPTIPPAVSRRSACPGCRKPTCRSRRQWPPRLARHCRTDWRSCRAPAASTSGGPPSSEGTAKHMGGAFMASHTVASGSSVRFQAAPPATHQPMKPWLRTRRA